MFIFAFKANFLRIWLKYKLWYRNWNCLRHDYTFVFLYCQFFTDYLQVFDNSAMKSIVYAKPTLCKYISRFNAESRAFSRKKWQADKNFAIPLKKCILQEKYGSIISKNHFNPFAPCFGHFNSFLDENSLKRLFHERHICYFPSSMKNTIISTIFLLSEHSTS